MQTINAATELLLKSGAWQRVTIAASGMSGSLTITEESIAGSSLTIDRNSVSGSNIEIGNAETSELTFELDNSLGQFAGFVFEGAQLIVDIAIGSVAIRAGVFTVDAPPKRLQTLQIQALDNMAKFNRPYVTALTGRQTMLTLLQDCCTRCGITLYSQTFTNQAQLVSTPTGDLSFHQVVAWIAELSGSNAWMDWNGELRLTWYGETQGAAVIPIVAGDRYGYEVAEKDITITGLTLKAETGDTSVGTDGYRLVIEGNPLASADDAATILAALQGKLVGFAYRPYKFTIFSAPHLWPLDKIRLTDADGAPIDSVITCHHITLNGNSAIEAKGETPTIRGYATATPFTPQQKTILQQVAQAEASRQVTSLETATLQLNNLAANSLGYYQTVYTDPTTGAITDYMHDNPVLASSMVIYKRAAAGFFWTDTGWNNGSPAWTSGYTAAGNLLAKILNVVGINAEWIMTGLLSSSNGNIRMDLTNGTLQIGSHLLDIADGTLKFTSSIATDIYDYIFQKSGADRCDMRVIGTFDTTEAFTWGPCRAEKRDDTGNEGVDFCF